MYETYSVSVKEAIAECVNTIESMVANAQRLVSQIVRGFKMRVPAFAAPMASLSPH
jgi:hypothetical protein